MFGLEPRGWRTNCTSYRKFDINEFVVTVLPGLKKNSASNLKKIRPFFSSFRIVSSKVPDHLGHFGRFLRFSDFSQGSPL